MTAEELRAIPPAKSWGALSHDGNLSPQATSVENAARSWALQIDCRCIEVEIRPAGQVDALLAEVTRLQTALSAERERCAKMCDELAAGSEKLANIAGASIGGGMLLEKAEAYQYAAEVIRKNV